MKIELKGRINADNAPQVEQEIMERLAAVSADEPVIIDAAALDYLSSAGLRILLRIRKNRTHMQIINVKPEVYEVMDITGLVMMLPVERAVRSISLEGCEEIGRGANASVYRLDRENIVKVYHNDTTLEQIIREREKAKLALVLGIPTAISYDVVKVGEEYGAVFELLNCSSMSKLLVDEPKKTDWCVMHYVRLLKQIHGTRAPEGKLPDMKEAVLSWAAYLKDYLPEQAESKLLSLIRAIPADDHLVHGDYHTNNVKILCQEEGKEEILLIDLETLSVGDPIFDLAMMYNAFVGFYELDHEAIKRFQGYDYETALALWRSTLSAYLGTNCAHKLDEVEEKARIIGYTRLIHRAIRRGAQENEKGRAELEFWKNELLTLLEKTEELSFRFDELQLTARTDYTEEVQAFVEERLAETDCPMKTQMQVNVSVEEIFVNIATYAYAPGVGMARIRAQVSGDPATLTICFTDRGVPYDPLKKEDPDVTLSIEERDIGGLGIYMTKRFMDEISYEYREGQNILTLRKYL